MCTNKHRSAFLTAVVVACVSTFASAATLNISDTPLFLTTNAEPLVMLALSNDEQLYHKAYTDFDDIDGDNAIDTTYKDTIDYYGYFDSKKCYSYSGTSAAGNFAPTASAVGANSHSCNTTSGGGRWSGNFLNWATMTRMDALRKVLYGGYRSTDTATLTMLERAYVPSDNHAWTKFYTASDLNQYTPYDAATYPTGITMCNVTPVGGSTDFSQTNTTTPRFRIANGQWPDWSAQESKQCLWTSEFTPNAANPNASPSDGIPAPSNKVDEFTVRVKVCDSSLVGTESCKAYGSSMKPVGLLQNFADADQLKIRFGLMTGSYGKRKSGGVLRKNIVRFTDEVNSSNGTFTGVDGIVKSINLMRISRYSYSQPGYSGTSPDNCPAGQNSWSNGSCANWGNPMGEMYLETLRYLVGGKSPNFSSDDTSWIANLNQASWINPYTNTTQAGGAAPYCAKPSVIAVSTGVVSFDNDEYSGASDIPGLGGLSGANSQTDTIGANEGINGNKWYVGSLTGGSPSDVCTSQTITSLSNVTGICPEAAGLQGSFKIAGLASFAHKSTTALQTVSGHAIKPVDTFAVALAPPTPSIKVAVGTTTVTIIPAGYNLRDSNAMQLINFRVINQTASSGTFFMNFENAPAGSDYDNDMKGFLSYIVSGNTIKIIMYQTGSSAGATQKMGYIIDGVMDAGTWYLLSNSNTFTSQVTGSKFFSTSISSINTSCQAAGFAADPTTQTNEECHYDVLSTSGGTENRYMRGVKTHTAGAATTNLLKSPLWYAAKWGGFKDKNNDGIPDPLEWDSDGDGVPDTYFPVTNAGLLGTQLSNVFNEIIARVASASSASVNSGSISSDTRLYQARFNSKDWTGQLLSYSINPSDGSLVTPFDWDAAAQLPGPTSRQIITTNIDSGTLVPSAFTWSAIGTTRQGQLDSDPTTAQNKLNYLRGDASKEGTNSPAFRTRPTKLGDIVDSTPLFVGIPPFRYNDSLESVPYSKFKSDNKSRKQIVYAGANDGMLHGFDAVTGAEIFGFVPSAVFGNLANLTNQTYTHQFFVDGPANMGDAFFGGSWQTVLAAGLNKGGQEIYALNITDPSTLASAQGNASGIVMWEFTDANDADLGYTFSRPAIVRLHNGKWAAVFGNGYNNTATDTHTSATGNAVLYIVDVQTGSLIKKISTGVGTSVDATGTSVPNGLNTPALADLDGDGTYDYAFAGDLFGNMWKFNLTSSNPSDWDVAFKDSSNKPQPLFQAKDSSGKTQPVTERPELIKGPKGVGMMVLFGTGKYLEARDQNLSPELDQSFYGILDKNTCTTTGCSASDRVTGRTSLTQQTILADSVDADNNSSTPNVPLRVTSDYPLGANSGWYIDLISPTSGYQNEKQVSNPVVRNGRVIFTTLIPDSNPCNFGGSSWLMELDALSGSRLTEPAFDVNRDGKVDSNDYVPITLADGTVIMVPASGIPSTEGILTSPGVVDATTTTNGGKEYKYTPGTSGNIQVTVENPGRNIYGRQSWRQIK